MATTDKSIFIDKNGIGDTIKINVGTDGADMHITTVVVNNGKQIMFGETDEVKKLAKILLSALDQQEKFVNNENAPDTDILLGKIITGYFDVVKVKYSELDNFVYIESNSKPVVNLTDSILTKKFIGGLLKANKTTK